MTGVGSGTDADVLESVFNIENISSSKFIVSGFELFESELRFISLLELGLSSKSKLSKFISDSISSKLSFFSSVLVLLDLLSELKKLGFSFGGSILLGLNVSLLPLKLELLSLFFFSFIHQ